LIFILVRRETVISFVAVSILTQGCQKSFCGECQQLSLCAGSRDAGVNITISGILNLLNYCVILIVYIMITNIYKCGCEPHNNNPDDRGLGIRVLT